MGRSRGAEVYVCDFSRHNSTDSAYDDADRRAACGVRRVGSGSLSPRRFGSTTVVLELAGDRLIGSRMFLNASSPQLSEDTVVGWPLRRMAARLKRKATEERIDVSALP